MDHGAATERDGSPRGLPIFCARCGYELSGIDPSPNVTCPECAAVNRFETLETRGIEQRGTRRVWLLGAAVFTIAAFGLFALGHRAGLPWLVFVSLLGPCGWCPGALVLIGHALAMDLPFGHRWSRRRLENAWLPASIVGALVYVMLFVAYFTAWGW